MNAIREDADPALRTFSETFREIARRAEEIVEPLSDEQLLTRPASGGWSVTECIGHLNVTGWPYTELFQQRIDAARGEGRTARRPYRPSLRGRLLIWFIGPPARLRVRSPSEFQPVTEADPRRTIHSFLELQEEFERLVSGSQGLDLNRIRFSSPLSDRLVLSLGEWYAFQAAHERRHLWQAERVVAGLAG